MTRAVIGRDDELGAIQDFLAAMADGPAALVLSGEPGIGKTILWEAGVEEARERRGRVLVCRGSRAEASLSFAGLSDLLGGVLEEASPSLAPPRRRALETALLLVEPAADPPDPHAIGLAVLDVLRGLAETDPLLVALDDAQWLDPASASVLQIALRRLRDEQVGVLATVRLAPDVSEPVELGRAVPESRLRHLEIGPVKLEALHRLLRDRLGLELVRPELIRMHEATAGNPLYALELGRELERTGTRPAPGRALRVPEGLRELLGGRLARLPGEPADVLLQCAALARPTVEVVTAAHGSRERVLAALEAAVEEGVVELGDSAIRFQHPLLASVCYEQAPPWKRRAVHRALAGVVSDVEERSRHLALAADGPDAAVADALDAAADQAAARGAPAAAAELSELAAELTASDPARHRRRRLRAAGLHGLAGSGDRAVALLEQLRDEVPRGRERADVLFELASRFPADTPTLIGLYDEALEEAGDDDGRAARILAYRSWVRLLEADVRAALADARAALEKAERVGDPALLATVIARVGQAEMWAGEVSPGLLERGAHLEAHHRPTFGYGASPRLWRDRLVLRQGRLDEARALLEEVERDAVSRGDEGLRVHALWYLAILEWFAGRWPRALENAGRAFELGEQTQFPQNRAWRGRVTALIEGDLGHIEEARTDVEEAIAWSRSTGNEVFRLLIVGVAGRIELALGDLRAAAGHLRDLPERLIAGGVNDPTNPAWADAIEVLVALGELERARTYLEHYERQALRLASPWARASSARCRGLLSAAGGDLAGGFEAFARALAELGEGTFPFEHGRTLLALGLVHRQANHKRAAREALEQAVGVFEELGAPLWAEKARAELRRISGRAAAPDELTESERRVAELAAVGRSNKEIAAELYMGLSTVEAHLSRVYRKLGVRSRAELAARSAAQS